MTDRAWVGQRKGKEEKGEGAKQEIKSNIWHSNVSEEQKELE